MERPVRRAHADGCGRGIAAILALAADPELIPFAGGFPDPQTFPRRTRGGAPRRARRDRRPRARSSTRRRAACRARSTRSRNGSRRSRAGARTDDELLVTSGGIDGARARGEVVPRPRRRGRRRGPDLPRRDHGLPQLRGARSSPCRIDDDGLDVDELAAAPRRRAAPEAPLHDPGPPEPRRRQPAGRAARRRSSSSRAATASSSSRTSPTASSASTGEALPSLWSLAPDVGRPARDDVEDLLPRRAARLGGRAGRGRRPARRREAEHRPVRLAARARSCGRSTRAAAARTSSSSARARSTGAGASGCSRRSSGRCRPTSRWTRPAGGFFSWLTLPGGLDAAAFAAAARSSAGVAVVPGRPVLPRRPRHGEPPALVQPVEDELIDDGHRAAGAAARPARGGRVTDPERYFAARRRDAVGPTPARGCAGTRSTPLEMVPGLTSSRCSATG